MTTTIICQGMSLHPAQLTWLQQWVRQHRHWSRFRLQRELCVLWNWRTATLQLKTYAARSLLIKLERRGLFQLPPLREHMRRKRPWNDLIPLDPPLASSSPIATCLDSLQPLHWRLLSHSAPELPQFAAYLHHYHYLGFQRAVGENLRYLVTDRYDRPLACFLFGAAAWRLAARDLFIGWDDPTRRRHLHLLANQSRFLLLPWVRVPHLASHLLGQVLRRLSSDWLQRYAHPIYLVETFVQRERFLGVCYRAANWIRVGQTKGRGRQDQDRRLVVPVKDIYLMPMCPHWRTALGVEGRHGR